MISKALACLLFFLSPAVAGSSVATDRHDYLEFIQCPTGLVPATNWPAVVVAIVDDGVRLTHEQIRPYLWKNSDELPDNRVDDDGNGLMDDIYGWDVADQDGNPAPPRHRQETLYHGTHLAGIVAHMAQTAYGKQAPEWIQLMPVKCISDSSRQTYLMEAYRGIEYALDQGADIILCAWGLGQISREETELLDRVQQQDVLLIASAGNLPEEREQYPGAHRSAFTVSALDSEDHKIYKATFGPFVDLMAPGEKIPGADVRGDTLFTNHTGTSFSAAIVAGAAAILKCREPTYTSEEIKACLMNSATVISPADSNYHGKLGAGKLNLQKALSSGFALPESAGSGLRATKGYLPLQGGTPQSWTLNPGGRIKGFRFRPAWIRRPMTGLLKFHKKMDRTDKPVIKRLTVGVDQEFYLPGATACVVFEPDSEYPSTTRAFLSYIAEPVNLSTLYCSGTQYVESEGVIEDGSGPHPYSPLTDGNALITAPPGKRVHFKFTEFDTEASVDKIYFFNGEGTHERIMAIFSGTELPPELTTWSHQVLVWFLSDGKTQGNGWRAEVRFVDPPRRDSTQRDRAATQGFNAKAQRTPRSAEKDIEIPSSGGVCPPRSDRKARIPRKMSRFSTPKHQECERSSWNVWIRWKEMWDVESRMWKEDLLPALHNDREAGCDKSGRDRSRGRGGLARAAGR